MSHCKTAGSMNKDVSRDTCLWPNMDARALTGHRAEAPKEGLLTVVGDPILNGLGPVNNDCGTTI